MLNNKQIALICAAFIKGCEAIGNLDSFRPSIIVYAKQHEKYLDGIEESK